MNREGYQHHAESEFADPLETPFSTFSTDVDTASYTNARRYLQNGNLPVPSSIRIEEFLNYFQYEPIAKDASHPVAVGILGSMPLEPKQLPLTSACRNRDRSSGRPPSSEPRLPH